MQTPSKTHDGDLILQCSHGISMILEGETFVQKVTQKSVKTTGSIRISERLPIAKIAFLQIDVFPRERFNPRG